MPRLLLLVFLFWALTTPVGAEIDPVLLAGLEARSIGPAAMSGRVAALDAVRADPDVIYVGAATGGVWKSTDAGLAWTPIFDDQPVAAIGAVAVFQPAPDVVWVGTGEGNPRNSASVGNGVYRSLDGGRTWSHLGLEKSERIHRIVLHPRDPDVAYVAALGTSWGENEERGVFKTTDGGGSWQKVLYVDERTGAADLVMDPSNPQKLFAALWDHRRWPWFFRSGGPGSGLWVTHDGGGTWRRLTPEDGLPEGELGRIGLAIAPSDPRIVYALVEAEKQNLVLRSEDGGESWQTRANTTDERAGNRPFYFADLRVDPVEPNRIYSLWSLISHSEDGGKTWEVLVPFNRAHPDHHAMWIDPADPRHLLIGNDGGVYVSHDRGRGWRFVRNLPLAQFYHLRVDRERPYNIYGGLQDNGSWKGPNEVWSNGGIRDYHWQEVGFGDGFDTAPDPEDPMQGYAMSQEGYLLRWNLRTGERKMIRPAPPAGEEALRFNWNAGLALDPFDPATIYFGSQYVHKSTDRGDSWTVLSRDLTTDNPEWQRQAESGGLTPDVTGAENYTSIVAIAPSPVERGVLWVGTDDGRLHVSRDGGDTWTSVEGNVPGVPQHTWIPHIEPSHFDAAEAFVVFDDHRRASWTTYVYRTRDYGATWTSLMDDDEVWGYALAIAQDPVDRDLLFLGTEFGLWLSVDGGGTWLRFTHGVPTVSVMDLTVQPDEHDLVLGTHGRAAYVLDDISPLRGLTAEVLAEPLHLFPIAAAQQHWVAQTGSSRFPGSGEFRGENPPYGMLITFSLADPELPLADDEAERRRKEAERRAERKAGDETAAAAEEGAEEEPPKAEIEVADATGEVLRTFERPVTRGLNRVAWDLRRDAFKQPPNPSPGNRPREPTGPEVLPGSYTVTVRYGEHQATATAEVLADPRFDISRADREAKWAALLRAGHLQDTAVEAIERIHATRDDVASILGRLAGRDPEERGEEKAEDPLRKSMEEQAKALRERLDGIERRLWDPPDTKGIVAGDAVLELLDEVSDRYLGSSWSAPTAAQLVYLERAEHQFGEILDELNRIFTEDVAGFRQKMEEAGIRLLPVEEPLMLPASSR